MAFCRAVYCLSPVPALTSSMSTLGYFFSKSSATFFRVGSQAHTVTLPPFSSAAATSFGPLSEAPASEASEPQAVTVSVNVVSAASAPSSLRAVCVRMKVLLVGGVRREGLRGGKAADQVGAVIP